VTGPLLFQVQDRETLEEALVLGDEVRDMWLEIATSHPKVLETPAPGFFLWNKHFGHPSKRAVSSVLPLGQRLTGECPALSHPRTCEEATRPADTQILGYEKHPTRSRQNETLRAHFAVPLRPSRRSSKSLP
jgi:hypothetical protein